MNEGRRKWQRGMKMVLVVGFLVFAQAGSGIQSSAFAQSASNPSAPFQEIFRQLAEIQSAVDALAGGSGEGNSTLRWDRALPAVQRFDVLEEFGGEAVLDKETGLVWEQSPEVGQVEWSLARGLCAQKAVGGRKGWRLPSFSELASLVDLSVGSSGPTLPLGHPFDNVQSSNYWSATLASRLSDTHSWDVNFENGFVSAGFQGANRYLWCVRGGMNADVY
jgi:hypothetical protein